jgi:hypothetical protein
VVADGHPEYNAPVYLAGHDEGVPAGLDLICNALVEAIQAMVCRSSSVATGPGFHAPAFMFTEAANASASVAIIVPDPIT